MAGSSSHPFIQVQTLSPPCRALSLLPLSRGEIERNRWFKKPVCTYLTVTFQQYSRNHSFWINPPSTNSTSPSELWHVSRVIKPTTCLYVSKLKHWVKVTLKRRVASSNFQVEWGSEKKALCLQNSFPLWTITFKEMNLSFVQGLSWQPFVTMHMPCDPQWQKSMDTLQPGKGRRDKCPTVRSLRPWCWIAKDPRPCLVIAAKIWLSNFTSHTGAKKQGEGGSVWPKRQTSGTRLHALTCASTAAES